MKKKYISKEQFVKSNSKRWLTQLGPFLRVIKVIAPSICVPPPIALSFPEKVVGWLQ